MGHTTRTAAFGRRVVVCLLLGLVGALVSACGTGRSGESASGPTAGSPTDSAGASGAVGSVSPRDGATSPSGATDPGDWQVLFDGSAATFDDWAYAGDGGVELRPDGTMRTRTGDEGGFGTLWYPDERFGDFALRLQFRDDAPGPADQRANSGVQVRFPALDGPVEGCPTTFDGTETGNLAWIAVNCGHEIQINDAPDGDPRKTGSVYGFADLALEEAQPTPKGTWNDLEIRVVGQDYTVVRNGVVINEYRNDPGVAFEGRPNDPDSSSRGLVGHVGLQAHGGDADVVSFRDIRIRELPAEG